MRPPSHFGNDITNTTASDGNNNQNNTPNTDGNNNNNNDGTGNGGGGGGGSPPDPNEMGGTMIFSRQAGRAIIRVVGRCDDAKENRNLDLSDCQLMQVPDAVYHLMRDTELKTCDLSSNVISKIPPKFALKFSLITDLNLSHNNLSKLPDELADLGCLQRLDISHNSFITLPPVVFKMPKLKQLLVNNNSIIDIDTDNMIVSDSLESVDLRHNPLTPGCHERLQSARVSFKIELTDREKEDWEDLTI